MGKSLILNFKRAKYIGAALVLVLAAMPINPITTWVASSNLASALTDAGEIETFSELLAAFDATYAEGDPGDVTIKLANDITQTDGAVDYLGVNAGWNVTLDLNGHTLTLRNDGARGLQNQGTLTITGNGTITNGTAANSAYGLIDNYGTIVVENGTFIDYGEGNGASIKNRPSGSSSLTIESGTFEGRGVNTGNACIYSDGDLVIKDGVHFTNASNRAYAVIVNSGTATIGEALGNDGDPVVVEGTHGALGTNGGTVVVNNGVYTAANYYGFWITNNNNVTDVTVNYGDFTGGTVGKNGLRASVDDGRQDVSDATIRINDGMFTGNGGAAAVAVNASGSEHSWGMAISGGEFSTDPDDSYLTQNKVSYLLSNGDYLVDDAPNWSGVSRRILVRVGEEGQVAGVVDNAIIQSYGEITTTNGATFDKTTGIAVAAVTGISDVKIDLPIQNDGYTTFKTVKLHAYDYDELGEVIVEAGSSVVKDANVKLNAGLDEYELSTIDTDIATIDQDGKITGVAVGETDIKLKVTVKETGETVERIIGTAKVYSLNVKSEVTIPVGTKLDLTDETIAQIGNPALVTAQVIEGNAVSLTGQTAADGGLEADAAGTTTIGFYVNGELAGRTVIKTYDLQDFDDMVLSVRNVGAEQFGQLEFSGENLPDYDITLDDEGVARAGKVRTSLFGSQSCRTAFVSGNLNCISAWGAGETTATITYADSLGTTETFKVLVSDYATRGVRGNHDVAQGGTVNFMIAEGYGQDSVTLEDDLGFNVVNDENGNYTVTVPADMPGGEYTLKFTDTVGGKVIATQDVRIRVHEIETSKDEVYVKKGTPVTITANEKNNYGEICDYLNILGYQILIGCDVEVDGSSRNGVTVRPNGNGGFEITANKAGEYTVTFSDGVAEKSVKVYAIDFEVKDLEYHVSSTDTTEKLINAINHYWGDTDHGAVKHLNGHTSSRFRVTDAADGSVEEGDGYNFRIRRGGAAADHYTLELFALINGQEVDSRIVDIYVYNMTNPSRSTYYGEINESTSEVTFSGIDVDDELNGIVPGMAVISASVTEGDENAVDLSGVADGKVKISKPGHYEVTYTDTMNQGNGEVADTWTATFNVYGLSAEADDAVLNLINEEKYSYTIDPSKTYGSVRTTITRQSPNGGRARQIYSNETRYDGTGTEVEEHTFDPTEYGEGKYTIRIENTSVGRHGLPAIVEEATFYVIAHEYGFVMVEQGETVEIESSSRWTVTSAYANDTDRLNVEDGKKVTVDTTGLELGMTTVELYHRFSRSQRESVKTVAILVYRVVADEETDPNKVTKETLVELIGEMSTSEDREAMLAKLQEVFGVDWLSSIVNLQMSMFAGQEIDTRVRVTDLDEADVEEAIIEAVNALGVDHVDYYDVSVLMEVNGIEIGKLHKLNDKITVALATVEDPATGYTRQYFVVRNHDGTVTVLTEGVDFYIEDGVIYVVADEFSTYAVAYKDILNPASPDTGAAARESGSVETTSSIVTVAGVLAAITLAGAAMFTKRK